MRIFRALGVAGWAYRTALSQAGRARIWVPFLVMAGVQLVSLGILLSFHRPGVAAWEVPLVIWGGGPQATHYPFFFLALPVLFARWNLLLGVVLGSLTTGAAMLLFAGAFGRKGPSSAWRAAGRRYGSLVVVGIVTALVSLVVMWLAGRVPQNLLLTDRTVRWSTRLGVLVLFAFLEGLVVYAMAWVVIEGRNALSSLAASVRMFWTMGWTTFVVVLVPVLLLYPLEYLTERGDLFLFQFRPELLAWLLVARILLELVFSFLLVGAVTRLFLWRREEAK